MLAWIDHKVQWPWIISIRPELISSGLSVRNITSQTSKQTHDNGKFKVVTDISLDTTTGILKILLTEIMHWPSPSDKNDLICQLHSWVCSGKRYQKGCMI